MSVARRHHRQDRVLGKVVAEWDDGCWELELPVGTEELVLQEGELHHHQIVVKPWAQPHDIDRAVILSDGAPPILEGGDTPSEKILAHHLYGEPGRPQSGDMRDSNLQIIVVFGEVGPIVSMDGPGLPRLAEDWGLLVQDVTPLCPPLFPLLMQVAGRLRLLWGAQRST